MAEKIQHQVQIEKGIEIVDASNEEVYEALTSILNEEINPHWNRTNEKYKEKQCKQVHYLSMEFLIGRLLESNLLNFGILDITNKALKKLGFNPEHIYVTERDPGLGNG